MSKRVWTVDLGRWLRSMRQPPNPEGLDDRDADERIACNAEALEIQRQRHEVTPAQVPRQPRRAEVRPIRKGNAA